jgi:lysophospholipase L1-like esterase
MNAGGGNEATLTTGKVDTNPVWSPDCRWVFFDRTPTAFEPAPRPTQVFVVPASGGQPVQLTANASGLDLNPTVSNNWILAYSHSPDGANEQIYLQSLGDTQIAAQPATSLDDSWPSFAPGDGTIPAPPRFTALFSAAQYVALGDSFSSGEGVPPFDSGSDTATDKCHRSVASYPHLLDQQTSLQLVADRACSGATTINIIGEGQWQDEPNAQITALSHATAAVTISVGGNDVLFAKVLKDCVVSNCKVLDSRLVTQQLNRLAQALPDVYRAIRLATSPSTRIFVVGYPQIFPDPDRTDVGNCSDVKAARGLRITAGEMTWLRESTVKLDTVIRTAANSVPGVVYVDPLGSRSTFPGHELCRSSSWFSGISDPAIFSFHPNALGQLAYARLIRMYF